VFGRSVLLFDTVDRQQIATLGDVRTPSIADLFVAILASTPVDMPGNQIAPIQGAAR
jgi:ABC-2 type transport system ATP-binding protein